MSRCIAEPFQGLRDFEQVVMIDRHGSKGAQLFFEDERRALILAAASRDKGLSSYGLHPGARPGRGRRRLRAAPQPLKCKQIIYQRYRDRA